MKYAARAILAALTLAAVYATTRVPITSQHPLLWVGKHTTLAGVLSLVLALSVVCLAVLVALFKLFTVAFPEDER